jgi:hypothetical protein
VEFKRSENELETEREKFENYEVAAEELHGKDQHHFLVYGSADGGASELSLHACTYFGRKQVSRPTDLLNKGLPPDAFNAYLTVLVNLKKVDGRSGGTIGPESIAAVVGVSSGRQRVGSTISLSEYCRIALPSLYEANTSSSTPPPPRQRGV